MKKIVLSIGILLVSFFLVVLLKKTTLQDYFRLQEAGKQSVVAVEMGSEIVTKADGTKLHTNDYKVKMPVKIQGKTWNVTLPFREAYGDVSLSLGKHAYENKTPVEGYFYYVGNVDRVYFSKTAENKQEWFWEQMEGIVGIVVGLDVCFLIAILIMSVMKGYNLPRELEGYPEASLLICNYRTPTYTVLMIFCFAFSGFLLYGVIALLMDLQIMPAIMMFFLALMFLALSITFSLFIKNYMVVFYPGGVFYRNVLKEIWNITDDKIESCHVIRAYRNRSLRIQTKGKNIWLNYYCSNYYQAEEYVQKYPISQ